MLINGEKYACDSCVRGHRVSNCQHSDRPLQHINKKGRPASQCPHCRSLRKARSSHVRCECGGEKAHTKAGCTSETTSQADGCCCSHGARCSCALKREHLDPVPESDSDEPAPSSAPTKEKRRPRALTAQSEGSLTHFVNGHHKPVHKNNTMAHKCGMPYPRVHPIHGLSPAGLGNRSVDNLPHMTAVEALHGESHLKDSIVSAQLEQRMVKSEHGSPVLSATTNVEQWDGILPQLDLSSLPGLQPLDDFSSAVEQDQPLFSAGLSAASVDWSHYDFNSSYTAPSYSQAPSFTGFDFSSIDQPALTTTSTSGEISEVEEFGSLGEKATSFPPLVHTKYGSDFDASDFGGDFDTYQLSTTSSYVGIPAPPAQNEEEIEGYDIDSFFKGSASGDFTTAPHGLPPSTYSEEHKLNQTITHLENNADLPELSVEDGDDGFWMNFNQNGVSVNDGCGTIPEESVWIR